jgi:hypothetical protein
MLLLLLENGKPKSCDIRDQRNIHASQQLHKHATVPEPSLRNVHMQKWRNCWKQCFICGPCQGCINKSGIVSSASGSQLVRLISQSRIDSWSWRSSSWREYWLKPAVWVWHWCEMLTTLQGRQPWSRGTSIVRSHYQAAWLKTLVCVWQWSVRCSHELYKCSIYPVINSKPVFCHTNTCSRIYDIKKCISSHQTSGDKELKEVYFKLKTVKILRGCS